MLILIIHQIIVALRFIIDRQVASGSFSEIAGIRLGGNSIGKVIFITVLRLFILTHHLIHLVTQ